MGLLRLYLAMCVIGQHATPVLPWTMHDGLQAVQIFYIISGFYMALVLSSTRYANVLRFYESRFLRIFPITWIVVVGVGALSLAAGVMTGHWLALGAYASRPFSANGTLGVAIAAVSNVTLFGQDWVMFLTHPRGAHLAITRNFWTDEHPLFLYLVVPQAWSVGVELCFYALVPFINRLRTVSLAALCAAAVVARLAAYSFMGLNHDPWTYRFFPFELFSFLLGMLAFRLYAANRHRLRTPAVASTLAAFGIVSALALGAFYVAAALIEHLSHHVDPTYGTLATYPLWAAGIAGLFAITRNNTYDRLVGELSFPIYLVHNFVIRLVKPALTAVSLSSAWLGPLSAAVSIAVAIVLFRLCVEPVDRARHELTIGAKTVQFENLRI
jgi:peptidoglycan/LPS O-acetylase OafA/YrhL